jgi:hypothetical protein
LERADCKWSAEKENRNTMQMTQVYLGGKIVKKAEEKKDD